MSEWFMEPVTTVAARGRGRADRAVRALQFTKPRYTVRFSNLELLDKVAPKRPGWRRHLTAGVFLAAVSLLVVSFAQPVMTVQVPEERTTIMLAFDTSLSMAAEDVDPNRFEAAQTAAKEFIDELPDRLNVGLVSFAGTAQLLVPPTREHDDIKASIDNLELDKATAIGDAVKLSLDVIEDQAVGLDGESPDAAIVLISDGETTVGLPTEEAIPLAVEAGVAVSTIAYGTAERGDPRRRGRRRRGPAHPVPVNVDELRDARRGHGRNGLHRRVGVGPALGVRRAGLDHRVRERQEDVAYRFVGFGLLLMLVAAGFSLRWFSRLP